MKRHWTPEKKHDFLKEMDKINAGLEKVLGSIDREIENVGEEPCSGCLVDLGQARGSIACLGHEIFQMMDFVEGLSKMPDR